MTSGASAGPALAQQHRRGHQDSPDAERGVQSDADRSGYRPDIEGLRAVAVLGVVAYHAAVPWFTGGYVGVDVFFVISGFLITGLLLKQIARDGRFRLRDFYARRARRILPAAGVVMAATAAASAIVLPPLVQRDVAKDIIASALNVGNWWFIAGQTDYLDAGRAQSPMLHYWSLGVEEQFYLVWAPLALLVVLAARRLRFATFTGLAITLGAVVAVSLYLCVYLTAVNGPLAYLSSVTRAWQFGLGGLAALLVHRMAIRSAPSASPAASPARRRAARAARLLLGWGGAAAVVGAMVVFTARTAFPGYAALLPTVGTAAVILAGTATPAFGAVGQLLATSPARAIGRLSYSWYLWHWPVLILAEAVTRPQPWQVKAALMLASAVPAYLTMRLVENPLRLWRRLSVRPGWSLALGAAAITIPLVAGLGLHTNAKTILANAPVAPPLPMVGATDGEHLVFDPPTLGATFRPSPADARGDLPAIGTCQIPPQWTESPPCLFGDTKSPTRVILFGDSHAAQWFPALDSLAHKRGWSLEVLAKSGCPVASMTVNNGQLGRVYTECDRWRQNSITRILNERHPALIFVSQLQGYTPDQDLLQRAWLKSLNALAPRGVPIVYLRDTPYPGVDVPACVSGAMTNPNSCAVKRADSVSPDPVADLIAVHAVPQTNLVDVDDLLCPTESCYVVLDGILLYRDNSHLTATAATLLAPRLEKALIDMSLVS
jgi:peptidoglycan/LPS O-acetylase OafA/YrhL